MSQDLQTLKKGAVVSCFFPLSESPHDPGPVARPALVVMTFFDRVDRIWKAVLAYGTSQLTRANMGFEIRMNREDSLARAGLHRPTRFTLSRMRILPLERRFFSCSETGTPVLGHIDDELITRLDRTLDILADIARPLKALLNMPDAGLPILEVMNNSPGIPVPQTPATSGQEIDRFMRVHLTGRADLGGLRRAQSRCA